MRFPSNAKRMLVSLLTSSALLMSATGCATRSVVTPPVAPPLIPLPPLVSEPLPSQGYWEKVCNFRKNLQDTLKLSPPMSGPCKLGGLTEPF